MSIDLILAVLWERYSASGGPFGAGKAGGRSLPHDSFDW